MENLSFENSAELAKNAKFKVSLESPRSEIKVKAKAVLGEITKKRIQNLQQQKQSLIEETISLVQQQHIKGDDLSDSLHSLS